MREVIKNIDKIHTFSQTFEQKKVSDFRKETKKFLLEAFTVFP